MFNTYTAVIHDGRIELTGDAPAALPADAAVPCHVTILTPLVVDTEALRKARRLAAMERAAARGGIASIPDAVAWQREQRKDSPLPGRELEE